MIWKTKEQEDIVPLFYLVPQMDGIALAVRPIF